MHVNSMGFLERVAPIFDPVDRPASPEPDLFIEQANRLG